MLKQITKRVRSSLLLTVVLLGILIQIPLTQTAFAANSVDSMSLENQTTSWYYWRAIQHCMNSANSEQTWNWSAIDIESGNWLNNDTSALSGNFAGFYGRDLLSDIGSDGGSSCRGNSNELLKRAFSLWGIDPLSIICGSPSTQDDDLMFRNNKEDCYASTKNFTTGLSDRYFNEALWPNKTALIMERIGEQVYDSGAAPNSLTSPMRYTYYLRTFVKGCAYGASFSDTPLTGSNIYSLSVYDPDSSDMKTVYIIGDKSSDTIVPTWPSDVVGALVPQGMACGDLATSLATGGTLSDAMLAYIKTNPDDPISEIGTSINSPGEETSTCQIEGVGWIVCPVTEFLASMADGVKNVLDGFLEIPATKLFSTNPTEGLFPYWKQILDYANIVFVVVFLLIIFSQLTSVGITNYGIKKLLPKLLIVAVLVNVSFYVCALAVDLSNVLGYNLQKLLSDAIKVPSGTIDNSFGGGDNPWGNLVGSILAAGAAGVGLAVGAYFFLATVVGAIISVIIAGIIILFLLTVRQALVIILIVLSPLAFAMMLLPNTEKVFKKWWSLFKSMLLIFPIVSLLYGAGSLAATVLSSSDNRLVQVVGATLPFVSLFAVFAVFKKAMSSIEGLGNLTNKMQNGFNKLGSPLTNLAGQRDKLARENLKQKFLAGNVRGLGRMGRRFTTGRKKWDSKIAANKDEAESVADQYARANLQSYANRSTAAKQISSNSQQAMKNAGNQNLLTASPGLLTEAKNLKEEEKKIDLDIETLQIQSADVNITNAAKESEMNKKREEALRDAAWSEHKQEDSNLRTIDNQTRALEMRQGIADRYRQGQFYQELDNNPNLQNVATGGGPRPGVDPNIQQRVTATATSQNVKAFNEVVEMEKSTLTNVPVGSVANNVAGLETIMHDTTASMERRAAAAGMIAKTGGDADIHRMFDYLGTTQGVESIQQQVASDIGQRKPAAIGALDISNLSRGQYNGDFESKIDWRLKSGKVSGEGTAKMSVDELERFITHAQSVNKSAMTADERDAFAQLADDITTFRTDPRTQANQPAKEIKDRMDRLAAALQ